MPRHARGPFRNARNREGRKRNIPWTETYGETIQERAQNIEQGNVPNTVLRRNYPPITEDPVDFQYIPLRRNLRFARSDSAIFNDINHRYVEFIPENEKNNRKYIYVRSQRYGEIVAGPRNPRRTKSNAPGQGIIDGSILKSVYYVRLNKALGRDNAKAIACSCESEVSPCKHMIAAERSYDLHDLTYADINNIGLQLSFFKL